MLDIKKVIKGIECCICQGKTRGPCSPECPYEVIEPDCWIVMNEDVLELLKEKQPRAVKNVHHFGDIALGDCPSCGDRVVKASCPNFCGKCGNRIDWTKAGEQE